MLPVLQRVLSGLWIALSWTGLKFWIGTKALFRWLFGIAPPEPAPKPLHQRAADYTRTRWNRVKARFSKKGAQEPELAAAQPPPVVQTATGAHKPRPIYEEQPPMPEPKPAAQKPGFWARVFAVPRSFAAGWKGYAEQRRARNATAA